HAQAKKNPINQSNASQWPQRPTKAKAKMMWIPKKKDVMHLKETSTMASKVANPPATQSSPPSPQSILDPKDPKSP
ncbi:hypothetical protein, partial [[Clostridium] innocuum]|uniref:hypothetical protein n=1 Tax=Clostridium innocuum TaxID=1522 RepID=UPI0005D2C2EC